MRRSSCRRRAKVSTARNCGASDALGRNAAQGTSMKHILGRTLAASTILSASALAAPERIRGIVSSVTPDTVTVHVADKDVAIALTPKTGFLKVVKSSLDKVEKDSFIGTATKDVGGKMIAL